MQTVNRLGLKAAAITALVLVVLVGLYAGARWLLGDSDPPEPASENAAAQVAAEEAAEVADADADGLPDLFENIYRTDPHNPDTDGDGTTDFDELEIGRDPTIKGPNDETKPVTGENLLEPKTYTEQYLASLPNDISRSDILNREQLEAFVNLNKGELLPTLTPADITTTEATGKDAVATYLGSISAAHNSELRPVTNDDIETALTAYLQLRPEVMDELIANLEHNIGTLKKVPAPAEVNELHRTLVVATQGLLDNIRQLRDIDDDFVGGLIASQKIDELGAVFQNIAEQVSALEAKYGLE